jgi:hypothetical protein
MVLSRWKLRSLCSTSTHQILKWGGIYKKSYEYLILIWCLGCLSMRVVLLIFVVTQYLNVKKFLGYISNSPEAGLLNKSSCSSPALIVTKFTNVREMISFKLCCATTVGLNVHQTWHYNTFYERNSFFKVVS